MEARSPLSRKRKEHQEFKKGLLQTAKHFVPKGKTLDKEVQLVLMPGKANDLNVLQHQRQHLLYDLMKQQTIRVDLFQKTKKTFGLSKGIVDHVCLAQLNQRVCYKCGISMMQCHQVQIAQEIIPPFDLVLLVPVTPLSPTKYNRGWVDKCIMQQGHLLRIRYYILFLLSLPIEESIEQCRRKRIPEWIKRIARPGDKPIMLHCLQEAGNVSRYKTTQLCNKEYQVDLLLRVDTNTSSPQTSCFCFHIENTLQNDVLVYFRFCNLQVLSHEQHCLNLVINGQYQQVKLQVEPHHVSFVYYLKKQSITSISSDFVYSLGRLQQVLEKMEGQLFSEAVHVQEIDETVHIENRLVSYRRWAFSSRLALPIWVMRITASSYAGKAKLILREKRAVVLLARESSMGGNCSYIMEGIMSSLLGGSYQCSLLKDMFVFYVVPMLNVEGCLLGNSHANVSGRYLYCDHDHPSQFCPENKSLQSLLTSLDEPLYMVMSLTQDNTLPYSSLRVPFSALDAPHLILQHMLMDRMLHRQMKSKGYRLNSDYLPNRPTPGSLEEYLITNNMTHYRLVFPQGYYDLHQNFSFFSAQQLREKGTDILSALLQFSVFSSGLIDRQDVIAHQCCYYSLLTIFRRSYDLTLQQHRHLMNSLVRRMKTKFTKHNMYVQLAKMLVTLGTSIQPGPLSQQQITDQSACQEYIKGLASQHHNIDTSFCIITQNVQGQPRNRNESVMSPATYKNFSNILFIQKLTSKQSREPNQEQDSTIRKKNDLKILKKAMADKQLLADTVYHKTWPRNYDRLFTSQQDQPKYHHDEFTYKIIKHSKEILLSLKLGKEHWRCFLDSRDILHVYKLRLDSDYEQLMKKYLNMDYKHYTNTELLQGIPYTKYQRDYSKIEERPIQLKQRQSRTLVQLCEQDRCPSLDHIDSQDKDGFMTTTRNNRQDDPWQKIWYGVKQGYLKMNQNKILNNFKQLRKDLLFIDEANKKVEYIFGKVKDIY